VILSLEGKGTRTPSTPGASLGCCLLLLLLLLLLLPCLIGWRWRQNSSSQIKCVLPNALRLGLI
jgi:hypothetical protein